MKNIKLLLSFLFFATILPSCKKDSSSVPVPFSGIYFKQNGSPIKLDTTSVSLITQLKSLQIDGYIYGQYSTPNNEQISINSTGIPATYTLDGSDASFGIHILKNGIWTYYHATSGTVTVTTASSTSTSGTFQFTATDPAGDVLTITDGKFSTKVDVYYN